MPNVEHSFVLYALLLEPGGCLRAHITLFELVEPEEKKKFHSAAVCVRSAAQRSANTHCCVPQWRRRGRLAFVSFIRFYEQLTSFFEYTLSTWTQLMVYLVLGGAVICYLETDADIRWKNEMVEKTLALNLTDAQWEGLEAAGLCKRPVSDGTTDWSFHNGVFFMLTAITTIGYGSLVPRTTGSLVFTCVYSLLGIGFVATITLRTVCLCLGRCCLPPPPPLSPHTYVTIPASDVVVCKTLQVLRVRESLKVKAAQA